MNQRTFRTAVRNGLGRAPMEIVKGVASHHIDTLHWAVSEWNGALDFYGCDHSTQVGWMIDRAGVARDAIGWIQAVSDGLYRADGYRAAVLAELHGLGHHDAGRVLVDLLRQGVEPPGNSLIRPLLSAQGGDGLLQVLTHFHERGLEIDPIDAGIWTDTLGRSLGRRAFSSFLRSQRANARVIEFQALRSKEVDKPPKVKTKRAPWEAVRTQLIGATKAQRRVILNHWGPKQHELESVAEFMLSATDRDLIRRLSICMTGRFPRPERLADRALNSSGRLRRQFAYAIERESPTLARDLGIQLIQLGDVEVGFDCVAPMATAEDAALLLAHVPKGLRNLNRLHHYQMNSSKVSVDCPEARELQRWAYEKGPCAYCRERSVTTLTGWKALDRRRLRECLYDASDDTRRVARRLLRTREGIP